MSVFIIADDLTGANDTVAQFVRHGVKSATILQLADSIFQLGFQALAFSTDSRAMPRERAYQCAYSLASRLKINREDLVYKKMDSAVRGNIGAEVAAVLDALPGYQAALVAPASPENRRVTQDGYQLINGIPVHQTEMARDPVTPVADSYLPCLMEDQSKKKTGYINLTEVSAGVANTRSRLRELLARGCQIIVADAVTNAHLDTLAQVLLSEKWILPCGSAGFAGALIRQKGLTGLKPSSRQPGNPAREKGCFLAVIGSKSRQSLLQVVYVKASLPQVPIIAVNPSALLADVAAEKEIARAVMTAQEKYAAAAMAVLCLDEETAVQPLMPDPFRIVSCLGEIVRRITAVVPLKAVFVTGGDTAAGLFEKLSIAALEIEEEFEPGVCKGRIIGGVAHGMTVLTKAGSFGTEAVLANIIEAWDGKTG